MNKNKILKILGVIVIVIVIILVIKQFTGNKVENMEANTNVIQNSEDDLKDINNMDRDISTKNNNSNIKKLDEEAKHHYTHTALQGCIIISSNSETGAVSYKMKCDTCGKTEGTATSTNLKGAILTSSYYCTNCKKTQKVELQTTDSYK